jgi:hypothetical protein
LYVEPFSSSRHATVKKADIPTECGDEMYDMALYALPGPHFILAGTKSLDSSSVNPICPKSIAFSTMDGGQIGKKQIVSPYMEDIKDLPKHTLGVAALTDILKAEENAEAIDEASYDVLKNNCIHYASSIWRRLGFDETEDLGNFLVQSIIIDEDLLRSGWHLNVVEGCSSKLCALKGWKIIGRTSCIPSFT